jgi:hypothetical protein
MPRRPTRPFEVIRAKLPPRPRGSTADAQAPGSNPESKPALDRDEAAREEPETPARDLKQSGPGAPRKKSPAPGRGERTR